MKNILLIDNYDSFTYNLLHYLGEEGAAVEVVRNDKLDIVELEARTECSRLPRASGASPIAERSSAEQGQNNIQAIVISPGPGTPDDSGLCPDIIRLFGPRIPIFGVCLGLQTMGAVYGGVVKRAPQPMHGKTSLIHHTGKGVFAGLPSPFTATRYHSLIIERETCPDCLEITAWTEDGLIMGAQHKEYPVHGVQFHPESIASEYGHEILRNFLKMV